MKAYLKTYGCQMNEQDSLQMGGLLSRMGYGRAESEFDADLILMVTCSIREKAEGKVYSELGKLRELAEEKPHLIVGVAGCVAQQEKGKILKRFPFLDMVFGPDAISQLPQMVEQVQKNKGLQKKESILNTRFNSRKDFEFVNLVVDGEENKVKAFVNIQKGCDNICSFCIVPFVRGREVSRPSQQIVDEIKALVDMGVKEVTLLGQNVNSYGLKDQGELSFAGLLKKICKETSLDWLRFTTSHPKDVKQDLISLFGELPQLCPNLHLPVQSGSNKILQAMRRYYTREDYLKIIQELRQVRPTMTFSTDFIVGFPGEDEKDFEDTINLLGEVGFDFSYSFAYSPRPGTSACQLPDLIPLEEKAQRLEILLNRQRQIAGEKHRLLEKTYQEVLVETWNELGHNGSGRTATNKIVHFTKTDGFAADPIGLKIPVLIEKGNPHSLKGIIHEH